MTAMTILLVEDNRDIASNIADYMADLGHTMDFATQGQQGLDLSLSNYYDLIILDLMLPDMDGLTVCKEIRKQADRHIPILMLTARDTLEDKVLGFEQGADDYLTKPFALQELNMRCMALSRRTLLHTEHTIELGELTIDRAQKTVSRANTSVDLKQMPFNILCILAEAHPRVVSKSELCQRLWGDEPTESDALRSHIYQLRQHLDKPFKKPLLKTTHGVGFSLDIK